MNLKFELNNFDLPTEDLEVPFIDEKNVELMANRKLTVQLTNHVFSRNATLLNSFTRAGL